VTEVQLKTAFVFKATEPIVRVIMLYFTKKAATVAVVFLMTIALCSTTIQEVKTQFIKNKVLSSSYSTKQHISQFSVFYFQFEYIYNISQMQVYVNVNLHNSLAIIVEVH